MPSPKAKGAAIYWFRKALRLHDNPALLHALENSTQVYPVFVLDPWFVANGRVGANRWRFLIQSLNDLNESLLARNSRLFLLRGSPSQCLLAKITEWNAKLLCWEVDTEPYAVSRDADITRLAAELGCETFSKTSHTLYDLAYLYKRSGEKVPGTYTGFRTLLSTIGEPVRPLPAPTAEMFKPVIVSDSELLNDDEYRVPTLDELYGVDLTGLSEKCFYPGGESEGVRRMNWKFESDSYIASFEKPSTSPNSLLPSTTVLSPYLKFGCVSARTFYYKLKEVYKRVKKHSQPPMSLEGQMLFREWFYMNGAYVPNFDKMKGNSLCRQIEWDATDKKSGKKETQAYLEAWREGRTGFPFIDAIMTQLRQEGWIHHLARHAVACFLTRGDLWISWERGQERFEELLLDHDWSLNSANWMWLSCSAFFHAYFRVYSPISFGKKTDPNGDYIRKYLPVLSKMPAKYIYEPWMAPPAVQTQAKCVVGVDYPKPIVDHTVISKVNIGRMKLAFERSKALKAAAVENNNNDENENEEIIKKEKNTPVKATRVVKKEVKKEEPQQIVKQEKQSSPVKAKFGRMTIKKEEEPEIKIKKEEKTTPVKVSSQKARSSKRSKLQ